MALGSKTIETRHWPTNIRGKVAIHAAAQRPQELLGHARLVGDVAPRGGSDRAPELVARGGQVVWVTVVIPAGSATLTIADLRRRIGAAEAGHSSSAIPSCSQSARSAIPITRPSCCTGWHRVAMNTEQGAPRAMRHVAFLD